MKLLWANKSFSYNRSMTKTRAVKKKGAKPKSLKREKYMLRKLIALMICFSWPVSLCGDTPDRVEFVIVIPSFNNEKYYEGNLNSICYQNSTLPYQVIYINDCSSDRTGELVDAYVKERNLENKVRVIHNQERLGSGVANIYNAIHSFVEDYQIAVVVDGDDRLPHNNVLMTLERHFKNPDVWMTHSKIKKVPTGDILGERVPQWMYDSGKLREEIRWQYLTALRAFRAGLFKKVAKEDLFYKGKFMTVNWDYGFYLPMIEMSGPNHYIFIDEILYLYQVDTGINDFSVRRYLQDEVDSYIRKLKKYTPISKPF